MNPKPYPEFIRIDEYLEAAARAIKPLLKKMHESTYQFASILNSVHEYLKTSDSDPAAFELWIQQSIGKNRRWGYSLARVGAYARSATNLSNSAGAYEIEGVVLTDTFTLPVYAFPVEATKAEILSAIDPRNLPRFVAAQGGWPALVVAERATLRLAVSEFLGRPRPEARPLSYSRIPPPERLTEGLQDPAYAASLEPAREVAHLYAVLHRINACLRRTPENLLMELRNEMSENVESLDQLLFASPTFRPSNADKDLAKV